MGLISLFFIAVFSLLYVSKSLSNKPEFVDKAVTKIAENIDMLSFVGLIYGIAATILTPVGIHGSVDLLIRLVANILIVLLTLPYGLAHIVNRYPDKINARIAAELTSFTGVITRNEKPLGYAGAVFALLLFAVLFR